MRKLLWLFLLGSAFAQTTPNLHLNVPPFGTLGWDVLMRQNFN